MATKPGDGKSAPFGSGQGTAVGAGKAKPFDAQTGTGPASPGKAPPFDEYAQSNQQAPLNNIELNQSQIPSGGRITHADPGKVGSATVGTGTQGKSRSGFRLKGG